MRAQTKKAIMVILLRRNLKDWLLEVMKKSLLNNKNAQRGPEKRDGRLSIRVLKSDKSVWQDAACQNDMTLAAWVEKALNSASKTEGSK